MTKKKTTTELIVALSGMYEKPSANNKMHLMKKLFNLKMAKGTPVTQHLNEFNTITNQLSSMKIGFDDEIRALILLASLPNSWKAIRMAMSNYAMKVKLNFDNTRDLMLVEEVKKIDSGEVFGSGSALNVDNEAKVIEEIIEARTGVGPNPNTKVRLGCILDKLFVGIVRSSGTSGRITEI